MGINGVVVSPGFDDAEVCGPSGLLEQLDSLEAVVLRLESLYSLIAVIATVLDANAMST